VAPGEWTQQDVPGLMVRCLLVMRPFDWNLLTNPNPKVPLFQDCQRWLTQHSRA
jgi:hypothetical protein